MRRVQRAHGAHIAYGSEGGPYLSVTYREEDPDWEGIIPTTEDYQRNTYPPYVQRAGRVTATGPQHEDWEGMGIDTAPWNLAPTPAAARAAHSVEDRVEHHEPQRETPAAHNGTQPHSEAPENAPVFDIRTMF